MDEHRCPKCNKLLMAMTDRTGRTELRCLKCDQIDPMKSPREMGRKFSGWPDKGGLGRHIFEG
jgi:phage FluMu protein Com